MERGNPENTITITFTEAELERLRFAVRRVKAEVKKMIWTQPDNRRVIGMELAELAELAVKLGAF